MEFDIATADALNIDDKEIDTLLTQVYVAGGFTRADEAALVFEPSAVRKRGLLIGARERRHSELAGMIIVVPPDSAARRLAQDNEAEIHLLSVMPAYRRFGLGRRLVETAVDRAKASGYSKIVLWTQLPMLSAQKIYEALGFVHVDMMEKNGREFKVYEIVLHA
jgi:ribosomal protein S18 acetylase RimI-like enzyme